MLFTCTGGFQQVCTFFSEPGTKNTKVHITWIFLKLKFSLINRIFSLSIAANIYIKRKYNAYV